MAAVPTAEMVARSPTEAGQLVAKLSAALPTRNYRIREAGILNPILRALIILESKLRVGSLEISFATISALSGPPLLVRFWAKADELRYDDSKKWLGQKQLLLDISEI